MKCLRCQGTMEEGFILDNRNIASVWSSKLPTFWGAFKRDKNQIPIKTSRCMKCGSLEMFAKV
jgi:hypothetical protein